MQATTNPAEISPLAMVQEKVWSELDEGWTKPESFPRCTSAERKDEFRRDFNTGCPSVCNTLVC
ncbi:MAG: hypothetical protein KIT83_14385 [Bryobacterales bacterium]|nr:hypothetical protein [Bryobacterales bacterium]